MVLSSARMTLSRRSHSILTDKSAVRKAHALEETRARKKQKLDGGRMKQVRVLLDKPLTANDVITC